MHTFLLLHRIRIYTGFYFRYISKGECFTLAGSHSLFIFFSSFKTQRMDLSAYTRSYHFICFFFLFLLSFRISSSIFRDFLLHIFVTIDPTCWGWQLRLASLVALQAACTPKVWWNRVDDHLQESQLGAIL